MKHLQTIIIPKLKGDEVIADSKLFFHIDSDFRNWETAEKGKATKKTKLDVFEMDKDATFEQMMSKEKLLTQEQILYVIENHKEVLRQDGYATFFPFKSNNVVFVALVRVSSGGLCVLVRRFSYGNVWGADARRRVVVPQLALKDFETSPSDTLALEKRVEELEATMEKIRKVIILE